MPPRIRAAALTNFAEIARSSGLDPYTMLAHARINPQVLDCPELPISAGPVAFLLEESARRSGCQCFGLRMGEKRSLASLGLVGLMLEHQATARDVIESLIRYQPLLAEAFAIKLVEDGERRIIRFDLAVGRRQSTELVMGFACRLIAGAMGGEWRPDSAHFTHSAPSDLAIHRRVFGDALVFDAEYSALVCGPNSLDVANPRADAHMAAHTAEMLDRLVAEKSALTH